MQENQNKLVVENGCAPITKTNISPHPSTLTNYQALLACREGASVCTSVTPKTQTRYSAEILLISAMTLLCCVAATHYNVVTPETIEDEKILKVQILEQKSCMEWFANHMVTYLLWQ